MQQKIQKFHLTREEKERQAYRFAAQNLLAKIQDKNVKVVGMTTSLPDQALQQRAAVRLAEELWGLKVPLQLMVLGAKQLPQVQVPATALEEYDAALLASHLKKLEPGTLALVSIPPVRLFTESLDCLSLTDGAVLLERYGYTGYKAYEETLWRMEQKGVQVLGLLTVR